MAGRTTGAVSEYATTVVRLFPDYAESVIWFMSPVPYDQTRLTTELVAELVVWEASYYAGLNADFRWRSAESEAEFHLHGRRLAHQLADQIGDEFEVEHDVLGGSRGRVRGHNPARNPDAAAAFRRRAETAVAEWENLGRLLAEGSDGPQTLEWRA